MITPSRLRGLPRGRRIPQAWGRAAARTATAARPGAQPVMRSEARSESTAPRGLPAWSGRSAQLAGLGRVVARKPRPWHGTEPAIPVPAPASAERAAGTNRPVRRSPDTDGLPARRRRSDSAFGGALQTSAGRAASAQHIATRASGACEPNAIPMRTRGAHAVDAPVSASGTTPGRSWGGPAPILAPGPRHVAKTAPAYLAARAMPMVCPDRARLAPPPWREGAPAWRDRESGQPEGLAGDLDRAVEAVRARVLPAVVAAALRRVDARLCDLMG